MAIVFVLDDRVVYSASDLAASARCEYALLRAFDAKLDRGPKVAVEDELLARTSSLGDEHERRQLDDLRAEFGGEVTVIGRPRYTDAGLRAANDQTMRAIRNRSPVIYQAAMFDGRFLGFADFLVLDDGHYRVADTKLARSAKVEALLQLAAYADTLVTAGVPVAPHAEIVLGNRNVARYRIDELIPVYRPRRAALQHLLDTHYAGGRAVDWDDEHVRACFSCPECSIQVREHDDLLLVANMRVSQRAKLIDAGVETLARLAEHSGPVAGLNPRTTAKLTAQARLQVAPRVDGKPPYEVVDPQPLAVLPDHDKGDLFFDFEGDPLFTVDGLDWGLEYLFGILTTTEKFTPLFAHDRAQERQALLAFLDLVHKQRRRHPKMHVYHYGSYEKTALLKLAGRHGVGEDEVDDLLRAGVLVDLLPLVTKSLLVGTESYSIKYLEPLYMGAQLRSGDVTTATDSITEYARFCDFQAQGCHDEAAVTLKEIEDYNHYDCTSTRRLRDWLLMRAIECGIPPRGPQPVDDGPRIDIDYHVERTLLRFVGDDPDERTPQQTAVAMMAAARGYHQREDKPFWWSHFDRLNNPVEEWADDADVFVGRAEVTVGWCVPKGARKPQRRVLLTGEIAAGELNKDMYALYEPPTPPGLSDDPDRRAFGNVSVLECNDPEVPTEVLVLERQPKNGEVFDQLPFALTPGPPIPTPKQRAAIDATASEVAASLPNLPPTAIVDILLRSAPRTMAGAELPRGGDITADLTAALLSLDSSYLAVHGPPGTGKTFTTSRVIAALVNEHRWRIGVVAQSHAVVENLFRDVLGAGVDPSLVAKKQGGSNPDWQEIDGGGYAAFIADHAGCVIGGTAWDFANDTRVPPGCLDLLVVEEAGQYSLANTIAVARAARNLLLLGDPQQLPQVVNGTHPEPVDCSALGWLVDGHNTLPEARGYFLDRSYRMHPAVCGPVSRLSYDGRLKSVESKTTARRLDGFEPGIHLRTIEHDGNSTESPEEAKVIVAEIQRLLQFDWTDELGTRRLGQRDVLIVTPYNAQVVTLRRNLDAAGLADVRAGTVDKFQGQQAPVVFISMAASTVDDVPHGVSFLFNRNRLNVAVSRAKYAAIIVRSTLLTEYLPTTPARLVELGAFLSLSPCDTPSG